MAPSNRLCFPASAPCICLALSCAAGWARGRLDGAEGFKPRAVLCKCLQIHVALVTCISSHSLQVKYMASMRHVNLLDYC